MNNAEQDQVLFQKLCRFCAYQERCKQDVRLKLIGLGVKGAAETSKWIGRLQADGFLDDGRYAKAYCRGKFRQNHWGRVKIVMGLRAKGVSADDINEGLNEIDEAEYIKTGCAVLQSKGWQTALSRGFEPHLLRAWAKTLAVEAPTED